jgi:hypothetical protein
MPPFKWDDIDHGLVGLKLTNLSEQMHQQIEADERRIQFENLGNLNSLAVPSLVLEMKERRSEEFVQKVYELYCDVWHTQGQKKSAAFLRAVYGGGILPVLTAQAGSITSEFAMFAGRTNFPSQVRDATLQGLGLRMKRLEDRWLRRIEAEAKECEHIEGRASSGVQSQAVDFSPTSVVLEVSGLPAPAVTTSAVTPKNSAAKKWESIEILFLSDHRIQIRVNGKSMESQNFAEFGFADGRTQNANKAWELLRVMAEERGIIRDGKAVGEDWSKVEKRIQEIRKVLREYFGLPDDPIPFVEGTGYQSRFKISCAPSFHT